MTSAERLITKAAEARLATFERARRLITDKNHDTVRTDTLGPRLKHALTAIARLNRAKRPHVDVIKAAHLRFDEEQVPVNVPYEYTYRSSEDTKAKNAAYKVYNTAREAIGKLERDAKAAVLGKSNKEAQPIVQQVLAALEQVQ